MTKHAALGLGRLNVVAMECVPEPFAVHIIPELAHLFGRSVVKILGGLDARLQQPPAQAISNAGYVFQRNLEQGEGMSRGCQMARPSP